MQGAADEPDGEMKSLAAKNTRKFYLRNCWVSVHQLHQSRKSRAQKILIGGILYRDTLTRVLA